MKQVTKDVIIADVLEINKEVAKVFLKHGLFCFACPTSSKESIEDVAKIHGIDIDELIKDLNEYIASLEK